MSRRRLFAALLLAVLAGAAGLAGCGTADRPGEVIDGVRVGAELGCVDGRSIPERGHRHLCGHEAVTPQGP